MENKQNNKFCVYLTIYRGNLMPPFYIGSTSVKNVKEENYHGSVKSFAYGKQWNLESKNNPHLFETKILTLHHTRREALERENDLQSKLNVVHNALYINQSLACGCFGDMPKEAKEKRKKTISDPRWIETVGKSSREKLSKVRLDDEWKEKVGKQAIEKYKNTIQSEEYKRGNGKVKSEKLSKTVNDPKWKSTTGKMKYEKISKLMQDAEWKKTKGEESKRKQKETRNDPEWKLKHSKTCIYCGKVCDSANFGKWHGEKCKHKDVALKQQMLDRSIQFLL